jgi:hypothetical protein
MSSVAKKTFLMKSPCGAEGEEKANIILEPETHNQGTFGTLQNSPKGIRTP